MSAPVSPDAQKTPEPLLSAEAIRVILLALGAGSWGAGLPVAVSVVTTVVTLVGSFALTMFARGRVWAMRQGVDLDGVIDRVQAESRGLAPLPDASVRPGSPYAG